MSGDGGIALRGGGDRFLSGALCGDAFLLCGDAVLRGGDALRCGGSAARGASARPLDRRRRSMRARSESDTSTPSVARASRSTRSGSGALRASRRSATAAALGRRAGTAVALGLRRSRGGAGGGATGSRGSAALPDAAASSASRRAFLALRAAIRSASVDICVQLTSTIMWLEKELFQEMCAAPERLGAREQQMFELYFVASGL